MNASLPPPPVTLAPPVTPETPALAVALSGLAALLLGIYVLLACTTRDWLVTHHAEGAPSSRGTCPRCIAYNVAALAPRPIAKSRLPISLEFT